MTIINMLLFLFFYFFPGNRDNIELCEMSEGYSFSHMEEETIICKRVK